MSDTDAIPPTPRGRGEAEGFTSPHEEPTLPYAHQEARKQDALAAATAFGAVLPPPPPEPGSEPPPFLASTQHPPPAPPDHESLPPPRSSAPPPPATSPWSTSPEEAITRPRPALDAPSAASVLQTKGIRAESPRIEPPHSPTPSTHPPATSAIPPSAAGGASPRRAVGLGILLGALLGAPVLWLAWRSAPHAATGSVAPSPPAPSSSPPPPVAAALPSHASPSSRTAAPHTAERPSPPPPLAPPSPSRSTEKPSPPPPLAPPSPSLPPDAISRIERLLEEARHRFARRHYRRASDAVLRALRALPEGAPSALRARVLTLHGRILLERGPLAVRRAESILAEATSLGAAPAEAWVFYAEALMERSPPKPREAARALQRYSKEAKGVPASGALGRRVRRLTRRIEAAKAHGTD